MVCPSPIDQTIKMPLLENSELNELLNLLSISCFNKIPIFIELFLCKNVGVAVGIIDGFVYLGTGVMSVTYGIVLPQEQFDAAGKLTGPVTDPNNWTPWPISMIVIGIIGFLLATRVWNAKPKGKKAPPVEAEAQES